MTSCGRVGVARQPGGEEQVSKLSRQASRFLPITFGLDLAAWFVFQRASFLAANPGSASALALCWVHVFVLPSLLDRPWRAPRRSALAVGAGLPAAALALIVGIAAGLFVGFAAFDVMVALVGRYDPNAAFDPPGPTLAALQDAMSYLVLWSGPAAGSAATAATAVGLAAALPGVRRPRLSWWFVLAGAWASLVLLPDWLVPALQPPWREPALLVAAGLPSALVIIHQMTARHQQS